VATSTSVDGKGLLQATVEIVSLNRRTAEAVNCCGDATITGAASTTEARQNDLGIRP
jgi:hypothetical protein